VKNVKAEQMLYPVCRIRLGSDGGIVFSGVFISPTEILTVYHGVSAAIKRVGLPGVNSEEVRHPITIEVFDYTDPKKPKPYKAEIVLYDETQDIALLKTVKYKSSYSAKIISEIDIAKCKIFDEVFSVGASLGHVPIPSRGIISYLNEQYDYGSYWMTDASITFGNSGGGVFRYNSKLKKHELIGITTHIEDNDSESVTHMVSFVPPPIIHGFLKLKTS
jgi:S1-C subfamily serine protease